MSRIGKKLRKVICENCIKKPECKYPEGKCSAMELLDRLEGK